jgi:hypothetical protein
VAGNAAGTDPEQVKGRGFQASVRGLIVIVLAAGLATSVLRSARDVWGKRTIRYSAALRSTPYPSDAEVPVERTVGLALEVAGMILIVILVPRLFSLTGPGTSLSNERGRNRWWSLAWRLGAVCFLVWFIWEESQILCVDFTRRAELASSIRGWWSFRYGLWQTLLPVCGLLGILGLSLGMGSGRLLTASPRPWRRPAMLFVVLAAVIAVLMVGNTDWVWFHAYFSLLNCEFVTIAMRQRPVPGPGVSARLLHAGGEAAIAGAMCLTLALAVARDFERLRRGESVTTTRPGRCVRLFLLVAAALGGVVISRVSIPALHEWQAEGFRVVVSPAEIAMIVSGFSVLAGGLAARTIAGPARERPPEPLVWLSACIRLGLLGVVLLAALAKLPPVSSFDPGVPPFALNAVAFVREPLADFWNRLPDPITIALAHWFEGERAVWTLMTAATIGLVLELAIRSGRAMQSPFDRLAELPQMTRPFLWLVAGLTTVALSALPILFVAGLVVVHLRVVGADILAQHWAN